MGDKIACEFFLSLTSVLVLDQRVLFYVALVSSTVRSPAYLYLCFTLKGDMAEVAAVGQRVVKVLEGRLPEGQSSRYLLPILSNVISLSPEALTEGKYIGDLGLLSGSVLWSDQKGL